MHQEDIEIKNRIAVKMRLAKSLYPSVKNCALLLNDQLFPCSGFDELRGCVSWIQDWQQYKDISILVTPENREDPIVFTCRAA